MQQLPSAQSQPFSLAILPASARLRAFSFWIAADRWLRTVPSERNRLRATSARLELVAEAESTSPSRGESGLSSSLSVTVHIRGGSSQCIFGEHLGTPEASGSSPLAPTGRTRTAWP